jgi:putative endonuclease
VLGVALRVAPRSTLVALLCNGRLTPSSAELGRIGEEVAARALTAQGWRLVGRNIRAPEAELDIVGRDGDTLVVVEVKTGRMPRGSDWATWRPARRITPLAIERRGRAARRIARGGRWRVDVVEVVVELDERTGERTVRVLRHARD